MFEWSVHFYLLCVNMLAKLLTSSEKRKAGAETRFAPMGLPPVSQPMNRDGYDTGVQREGELLSQNQKGVVRLAQSVCID